jgi:hypothetical protein
MEPRFRTEGTKFRRQQDSGAFPANFLRHYYDVYKLLGVTAVQDFIGTEAYKAHKVKRFRSGDNPDIAKNEAFRLSNPETRKIYADAYAATGALYYQARPEFDEILDEVGKVAETL